jgi:1,4-dihydroxy-2-naphthoate octaprenyltransferase
MQTYAIPQPGRAAAWLAAARPKTLTAALAPVMLGASVAWYESEAVRWLALAAAVFGSFAIQIGTNFANDVFDFEKGTDTAERLGPTRATQAGWIAPAAMRRAMWLTFALAVLSGIYLVAVGGWPIVVIGLLSIASGIAYTGGPWPLGYNGLGDLFVFVFFGLVATTGTTYVVSGEWSMLSLAAGALAGLPATAVLVVNNLRDRHTDVKTGKRTLAVRFGERFARTEYALLLWGSLALTPLLLLLGAPETTLVALIAAFPAWKTYRRFQAADGAALNLLLGETARFLLVFAVLLSLGFAAA